MVFWIPAAVYPGENLGLNNGREVFAVVDNFDTWLN